MVEFIGAFLGACVGVIAVYVYSYKKIVEDVEKQYKADIQIKFHED